MNEAPKLGDSSSRAHNIRVYLQWEGATCADDTQKGWISLLGYGRKAKRHDVINDQTAPSCHMIYFHVAGVGVDFRPGLRDGVGRRKD